jgi:hypothetical protein
VLSGLGKLAAGNYEEGWSRIDGEEQAMAADGGGRIERSGRRFGKLQEEVNESLVSFWVTLKRGGTGGCEDSKLECEDGGERSRRNGQIVARRKVRETNFGNEDNFEEDDQLIFRDFLEGRRGSLWT